MAIRGSRSALLPLFSLVAGAPRFALRCPHSFAASSRTSLARAAQAPRRHCQQKTGVKLYQRVVKWFVGPSRLEMSGPLFSHLAPGAPTGSTHFDKERMQPLSVYTARVEEHPDNAYYVAGLAICQAAHGMDCAETTFKRALSMEPNNPLVLSFYGMYLWKIYDDPLLADKFIHKSFVMLARMQADNFTVRLNAALFLGFGLLDVKESKRLLKELLLEKPLHSEVLYAIASLCLSSTDGAADVETVQHCLVTLLEREPNHFGAQLVAAGLYDRIIRDYDRAESWYLSALKLQPTNKQALYEYGMFLKNIRHDPVASERYLSFMKESMEAAEGDDSPEQPNFLSRLFR